MDVHQGTRPAKWQAQLVSQTRLNVSAGEALRLVREAWDAATNEHTL